MNGIKMNELIDLISQFHEAEFTYDGKTYVLQPEVDREKEYLTIWSCSEPACICRYETNEHNIIPKDVIDKVLSEKCFYGRSFFEIEHEITVNVIY